MNSQPISPGRTTTLVSNKVFQNSVDVPQRSGPRSATQPSGECKEVFFELDANSAKEVLLAGDFTGWEKTPVRLRKGEHGIWHATVKLAPGQYHYKFVVDGHWWDDPRAAARCPNPFGTSDSVFEIS
jgi:1,4-alpha-glucan branching enzyme